MMRGELNELRNEIMRRTKSTQIKRRLAQKNKERQLMFGGQQSQRYTTATTVATRHASKDEEKKRQTQLKTEVLDFMKEKVTRTTGSSAPKPQSKKQRQKILQTVKQSSQNVTDNVSIGDIANYLKKVTRSGWNPIENKKF